MELVADHVPSETLVPKHLYLDIEGAFRSEYRASDSTWSLATPEQLASGLAQLRMIIDSGKGAAWLQEREAAREACGQTTILVARKI